MECKTYPLETLGTYKFVVVLSKYQGKLMLSRHKKRTTWESQGGHIEAGETPLEAAKRELYEESGALRYKILPAFDYRATAGTGMVFIADIEELGPMPESEMQEVNFFHQPPENLTYPGITPVLLKAAADANLLIL